MLRPPRDFSKAYTEEELDEVKAIFRTMPSYKDGHISTTDNTLLCASIGYERTPEQLNAYVQYWNKNFGGMIPLDELMKVFRIIHNTVEVTINRTEAYDTDGDGFISADEFAELIKLVVIHEPKLRDVSYEEFVKEADINLDGKVSVDECRAWIQKRFP